MMNESGAREFKAILAGATGASGRYLFGELVKSQHVTEITTIGRRKATLPSEYDDFDLDEQEQSGRVKQVIIDFENINTDSVGQHFEDKDVYFSTFGTTRRNAGSAEQFRHIDYGYNYKLAEVAKEKQVKVMSLLSSQGADAGSMFLYLNSKGKLDDDCRKLGFSFFNVFRPGFLERGDQKRFFEKLASYVVTMMPVQIVARAMLASAEQCLSETPSEEPKSNMYYNDQIRHMGETYGLGQSQ